jgi:hypothetical protein
MDDLAEVIARAAIVRRICCRRCNPFELGALMSLLLEEAVMKHWIIALPALALVVGMAGPADAKGCLKGAVVGGVAGHMAHHGVLGAAAGCAVGHHMANKQAEQQRMDQQQINSDRNNSPDR